MEKKDIFDMLENAEDELMNDLTDMSPEISDEQLEKLLSVSERNYKVKKEEIERTRKDNDMTDDEDAVSGVDRVKRPVWLTPLLTAASVVLIAGAVLGTAALLKNNRNNINVNSDDIYVGITQTESGQSDPLVGTGSATDTTVTSKITTTTTVTTAEAATTTVFVEPDAEDMSLDTELGAIAFDMSEKDDQLLPLILGASAEYDQSDYIMFSLDPSLNRSCPDPTNDRNMLGNKVVYAHVTDSRFSCWDDIVEYLRNVYSADCERIKGFNDASARENAVFDDVETGDMLGEEHLRGFIEYRGRLYRMISGGKSYNMISTDVFPAIIANRTDKSFTAFVPLLDYGVLDEEITSNLAFYCKEIRFIMDPEYDDWRIDEIIYHDRPVYKELYEKLNG